MTKLAVQLFHAAHKMANGHFGRLFQMCIDVVLLTFCGVLREDGEEVELDTDIERLNHFCMGCVVDASI